MTSSQPTAGYFRSGLPCHRFGSSPRPLVVVQGLTFRGGAEPGGSLRCDHPARMGGKDQLSRLAGLGNGEQAVVEQIYRE